jgi:hypothetical protein
VVSTEQPAIRQKHPLSRAFSARCVLVPVSCLHACLSVLGAAVGHLAGLGERASIRAIIWYPRRLTWTPFCVTRPCAAPKHEQRKPPLGGYLLPRRIGRFLHAGGDFAISTEVSNFQPGARTLLLRQDLGSALVLLVLTFYLQGHARSSRTDTREPRPSGARS